MQSHLFETYQTKAVGLLKEKYGYKNVHQIPKIQKVSLNMGLGEALQNPKVIDEASKQMAMIAGQKPVVTRAKKSIAAFKLREKVAIGCMVTLRRQNMWNFLDKLIHVAIPRVRDFRGISPRSFDGSGNYTMGNRLRSDRSNPWHEHNHCYEHRLRSGIQRPLGRHGFPIQKLGKYGKKIDDC